MVGVVPFQLVLADNRNESEAVGDLGHTPAVVVAFHNGVVEEGAAAADAADDGGAGVVRCRRPRGDYTEESRLVPESQVVCRWSDTDTGWLDTLCCIERKTRLE